MKSFRRYIHESQGILLLNNETFYEDYCNNREARNGVKPQTYLTESQLNWLNDYADIDDYVLFGDDNTDSEVNIEQLTKDLKEIGSTDFSNNDTIKTYSKDNLHIFVSYHENMWCIYAPETFFKDTIKNVQFDNKK